MYMYLFINRVKFVDLFSDTLTLEAWVNDRYLPPTRHFLPAISWREQVSGRFLIHNLSPGL
jgi:hypothetical protein